MKHDIVRKSCLVKTRVFCKNTLGFDNDSHCHRHNSQVFLPAFQMDCLLVYVPITVERKPAMPAAQDTQGTSEKHSSTAGKEKDFSNLD